MSIDLIERPSTTPTGPEKNQPKTGIYSEEPIDYEAAANRYAVEAQDPTLSPLEVQAKQDIVSYAAQRAKELAQSKDAPSNTPTPEA